MSRQDARQLKKEVKLLCKVKKSRKPLKSFYSFYHLLDRLLPRGKKGVKIHRV